MDPGIDSRDGTSSAGLRESTKMASNVTSALRDESEVRSNSVATQNSQDRKEEDDLITRVLRFLSTATPGNLGAIAVGLAAVTYFILGQIGLVLIGAFGGIILFISWESRSPEVSRVVRGEGGYDFLERLLEMKTQLSALQTEEDEKAEAQTLARSFDDFQPETREALNAVVDAVVRDYVDWWYGPIVPTDRSFPLSCRKVLTSFILSISNHLSRKRPADAFVDFLTNCCSIMIVFLSEMTAAYSSLSLDNATTAPDAIYNYLSNNTDSPLANLLNQRQQASKFKLAAEDLLGYLERSSYDCDPARVFLREIISNIVLEGTLQTCSKAEWLNGWIVYLLEAGETDLSQALDEAMQEQKAFVDIDGNFGNISLAKGNRNSYDIECARKKELAHKVRQSKAEQEMQQAMEEMKKMNEMIAEAEKAKAEVPRSKTSEASGLLNQAMETNAKELDLPLPRQSSDLSAGEVSDSSYLSLTGMARGIPKAPSAHRESLATAPVSSRSSVDIPSRDSFSSQKHEVATNSPRISLDQPVTPVKTEASLSLYNAKLTLYDDAGSDKGRLRSRPNWDYFVQIEPAVADHPGWMVMKTYAQFEALHESLRRLATISGANVFLEAHTTFPIWKAHTRESLRAELETYIRTACSEKPLADSEAMKRFLEKGQDTRGNAHKGFSFESMGKDMLDAVQSAPKGVLDGGRTIMSGVTGVFGNIGRGQRKSTNPPAQDGQVPRVPSTNGIASTRPASLPALAKMDTEPSIKSRASTDSQRSSVISVQPGRMPPMERRPSSQVDLEHDGPVPARSDRWERRSTASSRVASRASSMAPGPSPLRSPSEMSLNNIKLPPLPQEISDDYESPATKRPSMERSKTSDGLLSPSSITSPTRSLSSSQLAKQPQTNGVTKKPKKKHFPLSEQETRVAVELGFAVINELYTLSSVWNIRKTLLAGVKSFLIRSGNASLISIQNLIQESVLDANTSDEGIAFYLKKLRENSLPTEEELKAWPAPPTAEEKEELRLKARKLFIQSGVPAALMGVMGQSATNVALGRVFDCLQIEEVARGLFFGILLQAIRVITH